MCATIIQENGCVAKLFSVTLRKLIPWRESEWVFEGKNYFEMHTIFLSEENCFTQ